MVMTTALPKFDGNTDFMFPQVCRHSQRTIECNGSIPIFVPSTVTRLVLSEISMEEFVHGRFCNVLWDSVTELEVTSIKTKTFVTFFDFTDGVFDCLRQLKSFWFSSRLLRHYTAYTFSGLINVSKFSLVECKTIHWRDLHSVLDDDRNLPNLKYLSLSGSGIYDNVLDLNSGLINALSKRQIVSLDLSYTSLMYNFSSTENLCQSLANLSDAGANTVKSERFMKSQPCQSLKILNHSDSQFLRNIFQDVKCVDETHGLFFSANFFKKVETVYIDKFATKEVNFRMKNCSFYMFDGTLVKAVHSSFNHVKDFDVEIINDKLEVLNFSHNGIKKINENAVQNLTLLKSLDLSHNKLSEKSCVFSRLLTKNEKLRTLHLSSNRLSDISIDTFESNVQLQELRLRKNKFQQIHFNITHLVNLSVLDLRHNKIETLDETSQTILDTLYANQLSSFGLENDNSNESLVEVLLEGNPFSCECKFLPFIRWFSASPIFSKSHTTYLCQIRNQSFQLGKPAIEAADRDCERIARKKLTLLLSVTLSPLCISLAITTVIIAHSRRKKKLLNQRFIDGIRRLRRNQHLYPVFLSYSSDDAPFVRQHILQQFQDNLQAITNIDRELVCNADQHFIPGHTIQKEIFRCLELCDVFIAVMSKNYVNSKFCRYEIEHAHLLKRHIILLFIEHVNVENMDILTREVFETFTRVQFLCENGQYRIQPGWQQVCESILQLSKTEAVEN